MRQLITRPLRWAFRRMGYDLVQSHDPDNPEVGFPPDFDEAESADVRAALPYTLTGPFRLVSLLRALAYLHRHQIAGDVVECGVWRGGSMMAAARGLLRLGDPSRHLWLYDTFSGMSEPTAEDVSVCDLSAKADFKSDYLRVSLETVRAVVDGTGYPRERVHYVQGKVEDTIPGQIPERIALLRLDTDWYESTRHELIHLFPRLVTGGVLIIDDYGHWKGARKAADEYFEANNVRILLDRIDFSARIAVKQ
jgi:hypothetical protein